MATVRRIPTHAGRSGLEPNSFGKGDDPRNCTSKNFKENFDAIKWSPKSGTKGYTKIVYK